MKRRKNTYATAPVMDYVLYLSYLAMPAIQPQRRNR